ncbi:MAG: PEP/pyruvate-binding domain-containing protein [Candidatus Woesearchaeota archaeon]
MEKAEPDYRTEDVLWFKDVKLKDIPVVGGKGASLGEMFHQFNIPDGFCITVNGYRKFMEDTGIVAHVHGLLDKLDVEGTEELDKVSKEIRDLIMKQKFPPDLKKEIVANYKKLKYLKVAVRSSATAEDLPTASFAGQQDTYLNIEGERDVIEAVQKCWASLFTSRAIYYREKNNFKHRDVLISVVIQEMIDADHAAVMFTVDPVNKKYLLIEVVEGLGEALVSGQVTPNTFFVHKSDDKIMEQHIEFEFDEMMLHKIAAVGRKIEKHYGKPMDIELAVKDGEIFILQARPITTL